MGAIGVPRVFVRHPLYIASRTVIARCLFLDRLSVKPGQDTDHDRIRRRSVYRSSWEIASISASRPERTIASSSPPMVDQHMVRKAILRPD
jgi:hypothetical protein